MRRPRRDELLAIVMVLALLPVLSAALSGQVPDGAAVRARALPTDEAVPAPSTTTDPTANPAAPVARTPRVYSEAEIIAIIDNAAAEFGADPGEIERVARCESGPSIDVNAIGDGGHALGPLQFHAETFMWLSRMSGLDYQLRDVADPEAQVRVAAWAFTHGWSSLWSCKP